MVSMGIFLSKIRIFAAVMANLFSSSDTPNIIAGPCSVESEEQIQGAARALVQIPEVKLLRGGIWKPRTRPDAFESL